MKPYEILRQPFSEEFIAALEKAMMALRYNVAPEWLGGFGFRMFGGPEGGTYKRVPLSPEFYAPFDFSREVAGLVKDQKFNTVFCQRYIEKDIVKSHRDPKNNILKTVVVVCGEFTGTYTKIDQDVVKMKRGDVLIMDCTIGSKRGPTHSVSQVETGTKYSFILNTLVNK